MLVTIEHPGPVRFRPRRAREARTVLMPMRTPVRLRELSLSDTGDGPRVLTNGNRYVTTRIVDGAPWRALGRDAWDRPVAGSPDAASFAAWLAGEPEAARALDRSDTARALAATPLVARVTAKTGLSRPHGDLPEPDGTLHADWRGRARQALVDFVGNEVALVGGIPMTRLRGPLAFYLDEGRSFRISRFPGTHTTVAPEQRGVYLRVDRVEAMARHLKAGCPDGHGAWCKSDFAFVEFTRDDDVAVSAAEFLRQASEACTRPGVPWLGAVGPDTLDRLLNLSALATVGLTEEELPGAYGLLDEVCARMGADPARRWYMLPHIAAYSRKVARPILEAARARPGDDVDSLAFLAP